MMCLLGGVELEKATELDDATAVARARAGDLDAYEFLVAQYTVPAHRAAVLLGAGAEADDVVQEALVKAYRQLSSYRGEAGFKAWLLAIVANETRNLHRSRQRRDGLVLRAFLHEEPAVAPDPAESAMAHERRRRLVEQLRRLDGRDREVLVCRYLLDLSEAETAVALGVRKGTVKSRTSRALTRLRDLLSTPTPAPAPAPEPEPAPKPEPAPAPAPAPAPEPEPAPAPAPAPGEEGTDA